MQNKIIAAGLGIAIVIAAGWYVLSRREAAPAGNGNEQNQGQEAGKSEENENGDNFAGTLGDLMARKTPVKCEAGLDIEGKPQKQTMYFAGDKFRVEMAMQIDEYTNNTFMIVKDGWQYVWSQGDMPGLLQAGVKMKFDAETGGDGQSDAPMQNGGVDMDQVMNFSCVPWVPDASKFELPAGIEFTDLSATMQNLETSPQDLCAVCEMIPDAAAKAECEAGCAR